MPLGLLGVLVVTAGASIAFPPLHERLGFRAFSALFAIELALYVLALLDLRRRPATTLSPRRLEREIALVLAGAVLLRLALVFQAPYLSDDVYRYVWDGKVQAAGINPYRFIPEAPELSALRDAAVFPNINRRAYAPTIYPPAAQLTFLVGYLLGGGTVLGMKLVMTAVDLAGVFALMRVLRGLGDDPRKVLAYAWHPLVCWEVAHSGHVDAVAIALIVATILAMRGPRRALAGALLGAATLVKGYPLLLVPAFLRRGRARFVAAFAAMFLLYLPYAGVGARVLGFLPTYIREEGLDTGSRYVPLRLLRSFVPVPTSLYVGAVATALAVVAAAAIWGKPRPTLSGSEARSEVRSAATIAGLALALGTPHYAWYGLWLIALVTIAPRPAWTYWASASALLYYLPHEGRSRALVEAGAYVPLVLLFARELGDRHSRRVSGAGSSSTTTASSSPRLVHRPTSSPTRVDEPSQDSHV